MQIKREVKSWLAATSEGEGEGVTGEEEDV